MKFYLKYICLSVILSFLFQGCISDEIVQKQSPEDLSIRIFPRINAANSNNRVLGNSFEAYDEIGLYVVPYTTESSQSGDIETSGYAQNMPYRLSGNSWQPISGKDILWPGVKKADIYGYYPYDASQVAPGNYQFQVKKDQREHTDYSRSDFLWTKVPALSPTKNVELIFSHILSKVNINIHSTQDGLIPDPNNIKVTITGVQTKGLINIGNGTVTGDMDTALSEVICRKQNATADGFDASFTGIIIPQVTSENKKLILIEFDGLNFYYSPTESLSFQKGTTKTFNIIINNWGISVTVDAINNWDDGGELNGNITNPAPRVLDISSIDWTASNVHHIYDNNALIGQACKEYIYQNGNVDIPAIVIYPLGTDGRVDLGKGFVAQVFNRTINTNNQFEPNMNQIHGGTVSFGQDNTLLSYQPGTFPLITKVQIVSADNISVAEDNSIPVLSTRSYTLSDVDGNVYPIVKIAAQYWIRENLKVEHYLDQSPIQMFYYNNNSEAYKNIFGGLYTWSSTVDERGVAPEGWHIPTEEEWWSLRNYLYPNPATKLKMPGLWSVTGNADNVTGFSGLPGGRKTNTDTFNEIYDYGQWWSATSKSTSDAWRVYFSSGAAIGSGNLSKAYTQSIRLLRDY